MEMEESFLCAIASNPGDDAQWLLFANWFEDKGDPRSEFLRLAIQLRRATRDSKRIRQARERLQQVRAMLDPSWLILIETFISPFRPETFGCDSAYLPFSEPIGRRGPIFTFESD